MPFSASAPSSLQATIFCGRLPKGYNVADLYALATQQGLRVVRTPVSRATYVFIEYENRDAALTAASLMNGALVSGSRIVVVPANQLTRLFIGGIDRRISAAAIRDAIARIEPVRLPPIQTPSPPLWRTQLPRQPRAQPAACAQGAP